MASHSAKRSRKRRKNQSSQQGGAHGVAALPAFPSHMELRWRTPVHADYMAAATFLWAA